MLPNDIHLYSAPVSNSDGSITMSLRFALTPEEFAFAQASGIIPEDTTEIEMIEDLPSLHDLHMPATVLQ